MKLRTGSPITTLIVYRRQPNWISWRSWIFLVVLIPIKLVKISSKYIFHFYIFYFNYIVFYVEYIFISTRCRIFQIFWIFLKELIYYFYTRVLFWTYLCWFIELKIETLFGLHFRVIYFFPMSLKVSVYQSYSLVWWMNFIFLCRLVSIFISNPSIL